MSVVYHSHIIYIQKNYYYICSDSAGMNETNCADRLHLAYIVSDIMNRGAIGQFDVGC